MPQPYNPSAWDRYAYVNNNPINRVDPTGHMQACPDGDTGGGCGSAGVYQAISVKNTPFSLSDVTSWELTNENLNALTPSGKKDSIVFALGIPSNFRAPSRNGLKVPTTLYYGISVVYDNTGGVQLYSETLDISFGPQLELSPGEKDNPSDLLGAGISLTRGLIWKKGFNTEQYFGEATSYGEGLDIVTADYYESFPGRNLIGLDMGVSAGSPVSGWRISTYAQPITGRLDITFWTDKY